MIDKLKLWAWPFIGGVVVGMALLSFGFGFVSGGSAAEQAQKAATDATVAALVPLCVANAQADEAGLAEVLALTSFRRRDGVKEAGWAVYPAGANSSLTRAIDQGCADALT